MRSRVALALPVLMAGCLSARSTVAGPAAPVRLSLEAGPRAVIRSAAQQLTAAGFLVTAIDSSATLRAEREPRPGEFDGLLTCRTAQSPEQRAGLAPKMIIDLAVHPAPDIGSVLVVASRVRTSYLRLTAAPAREHSDQDCRSTGVIEQRLVDRLTGQR
jgi:hypothetical protein